MKKFRNPMSSLLDADDRAALPGLLAALIAISTALLGTAIVVGMAIRVFTLAAGI